MSAEASLGNGDLRRDLKVVGLVGSGHFFAHFYVLVLPPLFPLLAGELQVSYLALGSLLAVANLTTSCFQVPVGFLVDRYGPRRILVSGLLAMSAAVVLAGYAPGYAALMATMVLLGAGNSVFHPADYAVMAAQIAPRRLGRAFSLHTFAGHLGWSLAPAIIMALTAFVSWRFALVVVGLAGLGAAFVIWWQGALLESPSPAPALEAERGEPAPATTAVPPRRGIALLLTAPMLLMFLYMVLSAVASNGLNGFTVVALVSGYDLPLASANLALTLLLVAGALGVLLGGQLADWTRRHELVLVAGFLLAAAALCLAGGLLTSFPPLAGAIALAGLMLGAIRPSRDMMVRKAAPAGSFGKVFGFVTMGMNLGGAVAPLLFGWVIDQDGGRMIFILAAGAMLLALLAALAANAVIGAAQKTPSPVRAQ
jgi:MFS family permease